MSDPIICAETPFLVADIEKHFAKLKAFVLEPPRPEPTGNDFDDWFNQLCLDGMPSEYAKAVAVAIKDAAKYYKMTPSCLKVTFRSPKEPYAHIRKIQQRIIELHREFYEFVTEHKIDLHHNNKVTEHGVSLYPPPPVRQSISRTRFENAKW